MPAVEKQVVDALNTVPEKKIKDTVNSVKTTVAHFEEENNENETVEGISGLHCIIVDSKTTSSLDFITDRVFGDISKQSALQQFGFGGVFGWISGYLGRKIEYFAVLAIGGTLLLIEIAQHNDYMNVDFIRAKHVMTMSAARAKVSSIKSQQALFDKVKMFYEDSFFVAAGFFTGFFAALI